MPQWVLHGDIAKITLGDGEKLRAQYDASIGRNTSLSTALTGGGEGILTKIARSTLNKLFGSEDIVAQFFEGPGEVLLSDPVFPGRIAEVQLVEGESLTMKRGAWLASDMSITLTPTVDSASSVLVKTVKGEFGESLLLRAETEAGSSGRVLVGSFGSIHCVELGPGEKYFVDNDNLLAWTEVKQSGKTAAESESPGKRTVLAGGALTSVLSGEGIEYEFTGPCALFLESSSKARFIKALATSSDLSTLLIPTLTQCPELKSLVQAEMKAELDGLKAQLALSQERIGALEKRSKL